VEIVAWLSSPNKSTKVTSLKPIKAKKTEKTINLTVTAVTNFYDYFPACSTNGPYCGITPKGKLFMLN
jgi:hypothetical protein